MTVKEAMEACDKVGEFLRKINEPTDEKEILSKPKKKYWKSLKNMLELFEFYGYKQNGSYMSNTSTNIKLEFLCRISHNPVRESDLSSILYQIPWLAFLQEER